MCVHTTQPFRRAAAFWSALHSVPSFDRKRVIKMWLSSPYMPPLCSGNFSFLFRCPFSERLHKRFFSPLPPPPPVALHKRLDADCHKVTIWHSETLRDRQWEREESHPISAVAESRLASLTRRLRRRPLSTAAAFCQSFNSPGWKKKSDTSFCHRLVAVASSLAPRSLDHFLSFPPSFDLHLRPAPGAKACLQAGKWTPETEHEAGDGPRRSRINRCSLVSGKLANTPGETAMLWRETFFLKTVLCSSIEICRQLKIKV